MSIPPVPVREEEVELGALMTPGGDASVPGIVLIHDVWGLGDHPRDLARRLAREGFAVLAIDLYRRRESIEIKDPGAWIQELSDPEVISDLEKAADFLAAHPAVGDESIGVVGFCMGGMYALLAACLCNGFAASVPFYGLLSHRHGLLQREGGLDPAKKPHEPLSVASQLRCPLLGFFGDEDPMIPLDDVRELESALHGAGASSEVVVVAGAGHAFMNDTRPDAFRPVAAATAWEKMLGFLRATLAKESPR